MSAIEHPSDQTLSALWSEDLSSAETERLLVHLESCCDCEQRLGRIDPSIRNYRRFVELADAHLPVPRRAWPDIWTEMERADRHKPVVAIAPRRPWHQPAIYIGSIAAAIMLILWTWSHGNSVVRAETLLTRARASAEHAPSRKHSRLRVGTRKSSFVRPAVLESNSADSALRAQFLAARYDWNDPLSAAAFTGWRSQLRSKSDRVSVSGEPVQYRIETTTQDSPVRDAWMTFEGRDLTPVSLKLLFDDQEWVEITALSPVPETVDSTLRSPAVIHPQPLPEPAVTDRQIARRELEVRLAIDALATESPAPVAVEVATQGSIEVTPYHLPPAQERQLRASLSGIEGVVLKSTEHDADAAGEVQSDAEPGIATAGTVASLAHLLAGLSDRFPPSRQAQLDPSGREALLHLRRRHTAQLNRELDTLARQLSGTREIVSDADSPESSARSAPSLAELVQACGSLNRLVTAIYTAGADHLDAATAWPELTREWNRVRHLAQAYAYHLETSAEAPR